MKEKLPLVLVAVALILSVIVDFFSIVYASGVFGFTLSLISAVAFTLLMVIFVWWFAHR